MSNLGEIGTFAADGQRVCERRRHKRKSVLSELGELVVVTLDSERGLLLTVSASGISVQAQAQLKPGSRLAVQFSLPSSKAALRATCDVVWAGNNCDAGLKFPPLAESDARVLENWLALHAAEPEDVMADAAVANIPCALMDEAVPASSAYADLAASIEMLVDAHADPIPSVPEPPPAAVVTPLEELLPRTVVQARVLTQAEGAALVLRGEEGLICRASSGNAPAMGSRMRAGSGLSGECFRLGQVVRCDDAENDSRVNSAIAQRLQSRSILIAPIQVKGSTAGVLQVLSSRPFAFTAAHGAALEHLAEVVGDFLAAKESATQAESKSTLAAAESAGAGPNSLELVPEKPSARTNGQQAIPLDTEPQAEEAAENAAIEAAAETDTQPLDADEAHSHSAARFLRNGAIGCLGLLSTGVLLWTMVQIPRPTRAALPATSAQLTPVLTLGTRPLVGQSAGVERGGVISQPQPLYPQAALRAGIEGSVVLATTIGRDGKIKKVKVVSGHRLLAQAAVDAVKQWRYQPSYLNGAPVEVDSTITLKFKRP